MQNNRLPKYWAVKNDGSQLFKDTVCKYLQNNYCEKWLGVSTEDYYGYDGNTRWNGTNSTSAVKYFEHEVSVLSIQEFIELTTEWKPQRGETVLVRNGQYHSWSERIFLSEIVGLKSPYICVQPGDNTAFKLGKFPIRSVEWRYMKRFEKTTELTMDEIAEKFGIPVEQLKIKK